MRHGNKINKLGRDAAHRKALLQNLASALFVHGSIETTLAKARELRPFAEKIVTKAIKANRAETFAKRLHLIRQVQRHIKNREAYHSVISVWAILCQGRPGGYTRIIKLGRRVGDNAEMAYIGIVLFDDYMKKYDVSFVGYKDAFKALSQKLLGERLLTRKLLTEWVYHTQMPKIRIDAWESTKKTRRIYFQLTFDVVSEAEGNWPTHGKKQEYLELPLIIEIDCFREVVESYSFEAENMRMLPRNRAATIFDVHYLPDKTSQTVTGTIDLKKNKTISNLEFCQVIVNSPAGRLFSSDLIRLLQPARPSNAPKPDSTRSNSTKPPEHE